MTYIFKSITPGYYATIPTYAVRSSKCTEVKVYDTDGNFKVISNSLLKKLYKERKLKVYTDEEGHHYIPSWSYLRFV